jgi:hypothetical protein
MRDLSSASPAEFLAAKSVGPARIRGVTPKQSGIPYLIADGGQPYKICGCILESHVWQYVHQKGNKFFYLEGHALMDYDHDFMVFLYHYLEEQVPASVRDEFVEARTPLPHWTRTRWLAEKASRVASETASYTSRRMIIERAGPSRGLAWVSSVSSIS